MTGFPRHPEFAVFRSFFPNPRIFFPAAVLWAVFCLALWFLAGPALQSVFSLAPWIATVPTAADPAPFFRADRVRLSQHLLLSGYVFCIPRCGLGDNPRWYWWSGVGSVPIVEVVFFDAQIVAWMNDWYGSFHDPLRAPMAEPASV